MEDKIRKVIKEQIKKLVEMKVTDKDGKDVTSDVIKAIEKDLEKRGLKFTKGYTSDPELRKDDPRYTKAEGLEPEDLDNPDEDLVIIGSGYLDIKSKFGERPSYTNDEYAKIGQKVVDQLHNGDKEAALDFILSKINEGMSPEEWADAKEAERLANHPEKEKIMKIRQMMDKEKEDAEFDAEQEEWDKGWYGESLKEAASKLGYLNEDDMLNKIEKGVTAITGGGRRHASVSDRGDSIRVSFRYMRGEFDPEEWDKILKYLTGMGFEIKDEDNSYEPNYDREEPPEWVPTIHLKK